MSGGVKKRGALGTWPQRLPVPVPVPTPARAVANRSGGVLGKGGSHAATGAAKAPGGGTEGKPGDMAGIGSGWNGRLPMEEAS